MHPVNEPKSARYHRLKRRASVLSLLCSAAVLMLVLGSGGSVLLRDFAESLTQSRPGVVAIYVIILAVIQEAAAFPLGFYRDFILEHRYELSTAPVSTWLRDHAKAFALSTLFLLLAAETAYALIALERPLVVAACRSHRRRCSRAARTACTGAVASGVLQVHAARACDVGRQAAGPVAQRRCSGAWCL